jgi:hypothetical protein
LHLQEYDLLGLADHLDERTYPHIIDAG